MVNDCWWVVSYFYIFIDYVAVEDNELSVLSHHVGQAPSPLSHLAISLFLHLKKKEEKA